MRRASWLIGVALLCASPVLGEARAPSVDELVSLERVSAPALAPDGRSVAFTLRAADWEEDAFRTQIWLVDSVGGPARQLTRREGSCRAPAFSPDSGLLAFLAEHEDKPQVHVINPRGGEAWRLTEAEEGVRRFGWAPDGKLIAYTTRDPVSEERKSREERFGKLEIVDEDQRFHHLHVMDLASHESRRLTEGPFVVESFDWSPDGVEIAFEQRASAGPADLGTADLSVVHVGSGTLRPLVRQAGPDTSPVWSPDGQRIAFGTALQNPDFYYSNTEIAVVSVAGGAVTALTRDFNEDAHLIDWGPDGIYFQASIRTALQVFRLDPHSGKARALVPGAERVGRGFSFDAGFEQVAFVGSDATAYPEIEIASLAGTRPPRRLTRLWEQLVDFQLGSPEVISWLSRDQTPIEGVLYRPADWAAGDRRPLIVVVHGGPAATSRPQRVATSSVYPIDIWLARGALVLQPNYRGSGGYGDKFRGLNVRQLGLGDAWDVLSGIDQLVEHGLVDPERVGVAGWSQGGYISAFLATHDADRFKAVSVGAGISDWMTYYVNTDIPPFTRQYLKATPWDDPEIYTQTSPITYVKQASAPVLIQHGEKDRRVPLPNAFELYRGLRDQGVPTRLVVYRGFGHGLDKPKAVRAAMYHNLDWFDRHLWNREPSPQASE